MFELLPQRRVCPSWLPPELGEFYASNRPTTPPHRSPADVVLHDVDQLCPLTGETFGRMAELLGACPTFPRWRSVNCIEIGAGRFGDAILYVPPSGAGPTAGVYALGPDVAGPQSSPEQPHWLLRLGASFGEWLSRLRRHGWIEYGLHPGDLGKLSKQEAAETRRYFSALNDDDDAWLSDAQ